MPPLLKPADQARLARWLPALTVVLVLIYAAIVYAIFLSPRIARLRAGGEFDLTAVRERLTDEQGYATRAAAAVAAYGAVNPDIRARVENVVTSAPDVPGLYVQVDRIAAANGFQLVTIDAVADPKASASADRRILRASLNVTGGDYAQFKRFLADLERSERILDVQSIVFTAATGSYSVALRAYYVDPAGTPAPAAGANAGAPAAADETTP